MIERLEADADVLAVHEFILCSRGARRLTRAARNLKT
jgi:hypothetical protein